MLILAGLFSSKAHKRRGKVHTVVCLECFSPSVLPSAQLAAPHGSPKAVPEVSGLQGG